MIETLNQMIEDGLQRKLVHNFTSSELNIPDTHIYIDNHPMINFGSCSYLGLEKHEQLKEGVVNAVLNNGTQFSSSRTYLSHFLYKDLENHLFKIFKRPLIASASTTLGHLATIPVVVGKNDAVILDLQVHSSIQMTVQQLKVKKIPIHIIKHNCMDSLESKIKSLYNKHDKIWYFADGVYSMYGDYAPFTALDNLLEKYDKFHLYIDDAHGMGWTGENGNGVVCKYLKNKEKVILTVSLNKSFASAGGCIVFPNSNMEKMVRNCGSTYIFSGPIQPPMLGAALASAKLHLSEEIKEIQGKLADLISYTNNKLDELNFPQFQKTESPLFFIPVGLPKVCYDIISRMKEKGFFLNTASFPAVPMRKSGIRFMVNNFLSKEQINEMLTTLSYVYAESITKNRTSYSKISKTFNIPSFNIKTDKQLSSENNNDQLNIKTYRSIKSIDKQEWNNIFYGNGTLTYANIELLEQVYCNSGSLENNWDFYYIVIKDNQNKIVLKTFVTVALTKDDMFNESYVSEKIETERSKNNPYYLTSKTVLTGSLITKGNHVYINYKHDHWKKALTLLTEQLTRIQEEKNATKIMIRDFYNSQQQGLETEMLEKGFIKFQLPKNMIIDNLNWKNTDEYLKSLSQKYRYNVKKEILCYESHFYTESKKPKNEDEINKTYELYENVFDNSYMFNVFKLPYEYFKQMCNSEEYDIIRLYLIKDDKKLLVGVMFSHVSNANYNAMIVGLDYNYVYEYNVYKQILYQTVQRAKKLNSIKIDLAFTAELEKKKLGAKPQNVFAYVQSTEHLKGSILEFI
ncbi:aminotransferase class I/II-fold pyridoxal phosphate-dependent enzyme [Flavobacteriaceae bacterium]|nr:aminotransferase class I/II-fold pyridoxal phosphate-dependent enzyme [Flavobacteriaceae bacterium]